MRAAAVSIVCALAGVAAADATPATPPVEAKPSPPDPYSEEQASEANLVSNAPRAGITFSATIGGGLVLGDGVGRGPSASFRVGHVATPRTVLTLEIEAGSLLHQPAGSGILHNDLANLFTGALYYVNPSFWIRGAGGVTFYTVHDPGQSDTPHAGVGGLIGFGLDFVRWHYLVLGVETFSTASIVATRGLMINSSIGLGLTYY